MSDDRRRRSLVGLTLLLYALLGDAAVETFASGSPVRRWVLGVSLVYLCGSAVLWLSDHALWRRASWGQRASATALVLTALLGFTVWLQGGLTAGLTLLGQPTGALLAVVTAAAVAVAGYVLFRSDLVPPVGRAVAGGIAAYAVLAFLLGAVLRTPYPDLFSGASFWAWLPRGLQGAFLGAFAIVPAGLVAVASGALRRAPPRRWAYQGLVLVLALDLAGAGLTTGSSEAFGGRLRVENGLGSDRDPEELVEETGELREQLPSEALVQDSSSSTPTAPLPPEIPVFDEAVPVPDSYRRYATELRNAIAFKGRLPAGMLKDNRIAIHALPEETTWDAIEGFYDQALSPSWRRAPEMRFARADELMEQLPAWKTWTRQEAERAEILSIYRLSVPGLDHAFLIADYLVLRENGGGQD